MEYRNETFRGDRLKLDGNGYHGCQFIDCTLVYCGGESPKLMECLFQSSRWEFDGAAAATVNFMRGLYHGAGEGGKRLIEETFNLIRAKE